MKKIIKAEVTFREYTWSTTPEAEDKRDRGEFLGSFKEKFEGKTALDVNKKVNDFLIEYRGRSKTDVQVWEIKQ